MSFSNSDLKTISSTFRSFSFGKVTLKPSHREGLPSQSTWRWIPIPDTTQITGGAGIRRVVSWGNSETPLIKSPSTVQLTFVIFKSAQDL